LIVIAYRLVRPQGGRGPKVREGTTLRAAIVTILAADFAMSLENILGVGAAAHGNVALLLFGLGLSIPIVLFGSGVVVGLLDRFPQATWVGALAILWTAADLIVSEPRARGAPPASVRRAAPDAAVRRDRCGLSLPARGAGARPREAAAPVRPAGAARFLILVRIVTRGAQPFGRFGSSARTCWKPAFRNIGSVPKNAKSSFTRSRVALGYASTAGAPRFPA